MENAKFTAAYSHTLSHEGGYSNNKADRGGETWRGIARNMWPEWAGWDIIDDYRERVESSMLDRVLANDAELEFYVNDFYYTEFWQPLNLDEFDQLVATELFDTAVNQGKGTAGKYIQQALNMLNNNAAHYPDVQVDGGIGPATIKAYRQYMKTSSMPARSVEKNIATLLKVLNGLQFKRYAEIVERDTAQEAFFYGWINRV